MERVRGVRVRERRGRVSVRLALGLLVLACGAPGARAQKASRSMSVGYVYPAGARRGTTSEHVIAGQFLGEIDRVEVSGGGVSAKIREFIRPITGRELNELRIKMDELMTRRAVARKDDRALANFRSFKNAKDLKNAGENDKELEELKRKYAGATWTPEDERLLAETRRKMSSGVRRPANPAICELVVCELTVEPDAVPGQRELRIGTSGSVSNPLVFHVGELPEVSEPASKEISEQRSAIAKTSFAPKNRGEKPELRFALPSVINGQILPGEIDRYRFEAKKGQRVVFATSARQLIPYISDAVPGWFQATLCLYDAGGNELAYADDFRFDPDPVFCYQIPADGEYVMEIKDAIYRGREDFVYRITVGEIPFITSIYPLGGPAGKPTPVELRGWNLPMMALTADDHGRGAGIFPLRVRAGGLVSNTVPFSFDALPECDEAERGDGVAQPVRLPVIVNGRIGKPDDLDLFAFEGRAGQRVVAEVMARRLNSPLDASLTLTDVAGAQIAFNDDHTDRGAGLTTHHADPYLDLTLPMDGTYTVRLVDAQHRGGADYAYRLRIGAPMPDYALRVVPSSLAARAGSTSTVTVHALRRDGFDAPIRIALRDAPEGFKLGGGEVPAGVESVKLTLTAPPAASDRPVTLQMEGRATIGGREVVRPVVPAEDRMQAFEYRQLVPSQEMRVAISGRASARMPEVRLVGDMPVRIPVGGTASVLFSGGGPAIASRARLELTDPPDGIVIRKVESSGEGVEVVLGTDAEKVKPGLKGNLIVGAYPTRAKTSSKSKGKTMDAGPGPFATLPAIPFEVTKK